MSIKALELGVQPSAPASPSSGKRKLFLNAQGKLCYKDHDGSVVQVGTTSYSDLSNVPASFPPSAHTHSYEELTSGPAEQGRVIAADGVGGFDLIELDAAAASYAVKSAPYTATAGDKIAADTSGGPWTLTLPSNPTAGDVIEVLDYSGQFASKPLVVARNGQKIESLNEDLTCNVSGACFFLVFAGTIKGWQLVTTFSAGGGAGGVDWSELVGVPSLFPPEAHGHVAADISDFASAVEAVAPPTTDASLLTSGTLNDARLSTAVQTSLGKADTASQPGHTHELADLGDTADFINSKVQPEALLGSRYKGEYNNGADYNPGDVVIYGGVLYVRVGEANPGYPPGTTYWDTWKLDKADLGLSAVDNTSDADKPISTAVQSALDGKQPAGSYATLVNGEIPAAQLPSYVDDVLEYADELSRPSIGQSGKIYVTLDNNKCWRWSGSAYVEISPSPGSTDSVSEGAVNLYHTTARAAAAAPVQSVSTKTGIVTLDKDDVGLGNVDNTSDLDKPVSTAVQGQLNNKAEVVHSASHRPGEADTILAEALTISTNLAEYIGPYCYTGDSANGKPVFYKPGSNGLVFVDFQASGRWCLNDNGTVIRQSTAGNAERPWQANWPQAGAVTFFVVTQLTLEGLAQKTLETSSPFGHTHTSTDIVGGTLNLPVPKIRFVNPVAPMQLLDVTTGGNGGPVLIQNGPVVYASDLPSGLFGKLFVEGVIFSKLTPLQTGGSYRKVFAAPSPHYPVTQTIFPWGNNSPSRSGGHFAGLGNLGISIDRPNLFPVQAHNEKIDAYKFLNGRFRVRSVEYRSASTGDYAYVDCVVPSVGTKARRPGKKHPYSSYLCPLRIAFRYVVYDAAYGHFLSGPLSPTIKIWHSPFPFNVDHVASSFYGYPVASINPAYSAATSAGGATLKCWID